MVKSYGLGSVLAPRKKKLLNLARLSRSLTALFLNVTNVQCAEPHSTTSPQLKYTAHRIAVPHHHSSMSHGHRHKMLPPPRPTYTFNRNALVLGFHRFLKCQLFDLLFVSVFESDLLDVLGPKINV